MSAHHLQSRGTPSTSHVAIDPADIRVRAQAARAASRQVAALSTDTKNSILLLLADLIDQEASAVLMANERDVEESLAAGLADAKLQRLALTPKSLGQIASGIRSVAALPDPVGQVTREVPAHGPLAAPSGLHIRKIRAPLGVIAMIYEARPGVTVDAFSLCLKAGNACILRGGKEARHSNAALTSLAHQALTQHNVAVDALVNLSGSSREALEQLLTLDQWIDLVIPRGGRELIDMVCRTSRIPTVQHFQGVCHVYVHEDADLDMAIRICVTGKTSAPATCNALECVLVHRGIADALVPRLIEAYVRAGVEVRCTPLVLALAPPSCKDVPTLPTHDGKPVPRGARLANPDDFGAEFLDLVVAMRTVESLAEAIEHVAQYGSNHTDAIVTAPGGESAAAIEFVRRVQSSCVLVNASTRFNDGFQLGLGAEIGISTSRIHAYGPMGLEELTTQRWVAVGQGQTR